MMNTITLSKKHIFVGNLLLVNAALPLQITKENDLIPATAAFPDVLMKREAANVLQMIFEKLGCANQIVPVSGYRNANKQTEIYEASLQENGKDFTSKFVALPHHSEHQTGLAIDLGLNKAVIDFICPEFPYTGICHEFRKMAPTYGFIERYPRKKEKITGIAHEPWHFRYVGYPHSEIMNEHQLTLEEYVVFIKQFSYTGNYLQKHKHGKVIEVFYTAADKSEETIISLPEEAVYQVSGNNIDGFIVTLWRDL